MKLPTMRTPVAAALLCTLALLTACQTREAPRQAGDVARGALLYDNACLQCHTAQAHWRDKRIVDSWPSLVAQVDRWQKASGARWTEAEIRDVAAYLNQRFYKMPAPAGS